MGEAYVTKADMKSKHFFFFSNFIPCVQLLKKERNSRQYTEIWVEMGEGGIRDAQYPTSMRVRELGGRRSRPLLLFLLFFFSVILKSVRKTANGNFYFYFSL
jgi:hypothetical protein